jgi:cysteinyl-tRNA synthetase
VALLSAICDAQDRAHASLLDNINTAGAMDALAAIVKATNLYLAAAGERAARSGASASNGTGTGAAAAGAGAGAGPQPLLLRKAAAYVTRILSVFGVVPAPSDAPGLGGEGGGEGGGDARGAAYLDAFSAFRDEVRRAVGEGRGAACMALAARVTAASTVPAGMPHRAPSLPLPPQVRSLAKAKAQPSDILAACDAVRDGVCVDLGVRLEDRPDGEP